MAHDLVIVEQGLTVGLEKENLVLYRAGKAIQEKKLQQLEQVILCGQIELTSAARRVLLHKGIDVVFLSLKGRYQGRLVGHMSRNVDLRLAQYRFCQSRDACLGAARKIVEGKLRNQRNLLLRAQRQLKLETVARSLAGMRVVLKKAGQADNLDSLRGLEGQGAALYFQAFPCLIRREGFAMNGRNRRPPRDPVNAILSFGYSVLTGLLESYTLRVGLDSHVGCFHQSHYGRPSMVLDLVEEFRPVVIDPLVLRLINRGQLKPIDFYNPEDVEVAEAILEGDANPPPSGPAVYLAQTGQKVFFQALYARLRERALYPRQQASLELKSILLQQVYHMARVIQGEEAEYQAFVPR